MHFLNLKVLICVSFYLFPSLLAITSVQKRLLVNDPSHVQLQWDQISQRLQALESKVNLQQTTIIAQQNEISNLQSHVSDLTAAVNNGSISNSHVAFSARLTKQQTGVGVGQTIIYDKIVTNYGSAYNPTDGIFIAPVTGLYVFTWTATSDEGRVVKSELTKQGDVYGYAVADSYSSGDYGSSQNTVILKVNAGDHVHISVSVAQNGYIEGGNYDTFSGWLIYEM